MDLKSTSSNVLGQLLDTIRQVGEEDYQQIIPMLNASIGQHVRHIVEFFICLFEGLQSGEVSYDQRKRDKRIESDKQFAIDLMGDIIRRINGFNHNPDLLLIVKYGESLDDHLTLSTNYERELAYNIEHAIHHMAIVKQGFREVCPYIELPEDFGVASSTLRNSKRD